MTASGDGAWHCRHSTRGTYDEAARRVGHAELAVAELLVREGHHVKSLPEGRGPGRTADFLACGVLVEAKSFRPLAQRQGRAPSAAAVANKMLDARGQGAIVVIWAVGSGLAEPTARSGYLMFCQQAMAEGLGRLRSVRVVGEGFEVNFDPVADLRASWQARQQAGNAISGRSLRRRSEQLLPAERSPGRQGLAHRGLSLRPGVAKPGQLSPKAPKL